ncbi:hypothetical protein [Marinobacter sp. OP 3.4]|uniref:hypothetical protein n=1 Tax=Marinobacter sp. OP 3.4 TaxID=3076501 RepID=UPI002E2261FF
MRRRNWKRANPTSLRHAMELCLDYGREKRNLSVERVADLMGIPSKWTLYKYLENGRMPATLIRPFEHACGATFVTQYIGASAQKLLIDIPTGQAADQDDLLTLQTVLNDTVSLLAQFYKGNLESEEVMGGLTAAMGQLAGHRCNVEKAAAPELALFEGDAE